MWNIRSHARRFPVHTGTLTPSIAHPNRFLNHLKLFSAGFLTFRGGKTKKRMVLGAESTIWNARREAGQPSQSSPVGLASSPNGRALGMAAQFPGRPQSLRVRLLPLGGAVAQRLKGFKSAEHKKSFSEATWIFCMEPNSFGVTRGEQPLVCNGDDRGQWPKQGGAVGTAACRMRVPRKARSRRREPQPAASRASKVAETLPR